MIYKSTILEIKDNTGARKAKCIHVLEKRRCGVISSLIIVVLRKIHCLRKKLKKKGIYLGVIIGVRT